MGVGAIDGKQTASASRLQMDRKKQRESCLVEYTAWCMGGVDAGIKAKGLDMTEEGRKSLFFVFSCVVDPAGKLVPAGSVKPRQNVE